MITLPSPAQDSGATYTQTATYEHAVIDPDTLHYPRQLCAAIGLGVNQINALKRVGCPFFGRKTTLRWVRDFLNDRAGATPEQARAVVARPPEVSPWPSAYLPPKGASKCGEPT